MAKSPILPPLESLLDLACRDGVDIRPTLLRVLTDLYVQKQAHNAEEEIQYVELALGLINAVDAPTRAAVAARLSAYPNAPAAVLTRLTEESDQPPGSAPTPRSAGTHDDLVSLFFEASSDERRLILANLDAAGGPIAPMPPAFPETIRRLEAAALSRNAGEFGRLLERALGIGHDIAGRIVRDRSGEPIVIAAKTLGMPAAVLQRILLFLNPAIGQSVERVYDLASLFEQLKPTAAARMVAIWRAGTSSRAAHAPVFWDDNRRNARLAAAPTPQRAAQPHEQSAPPTRFKSN